MRAVKVVFEVNTRPLRAVLDDAAVAVGSMDEGEADARALGRTLEEIDEIAEPNSYQVLRLPEPERLPWERP